MLRYTGDLIPWEASRFKVQGDRKRIWGSLANTDKLNNKLNLIEDASVHRALVSTTARLSITIWIVEENLWAYIHAHNIHHV